MEFEARGLYEEAKRFTESSSLQTLDVSRVLHHMDQSGVQNCRVVKAGGLAQEVPADMKVAVPRRFLQFSSSPSQFVAPERKTHLEQGFMRAVSRAHMHVEYAGFPIAKQRLHGHEIAAPAAVEDGRAFRHHVV